MHIHVHTYRQICTVLHNRQRNLRIRKLYTFPAIASGRRTAALDYSARNGHLPPSILPSLPSFSPRYVILICPLLCARCRGDNGGDCVEYSNQRADCESPGDFATSPPRSVASRCLLSSCRRPSSLIPQERALPTSEGSFPTSPTTLALPSFPPFASGLRTLDLA